MRAWVLIAKIGRLQRVAFKSFLVQKWVIKLIKFARLPGPQRISIELLGGLWRFSCWRVSCFKTMIPVLKRADKLRRNRTKVKGCGYMWNKIHEKNQAVLLMHWLSYHNTDSASPFLSLSVIALQKRKTTFDTHKSSIFSFPLTVPSAYLFGKRKNLPSKEGKISVSRLTFSSSSLCPTPQNGFLRPSLHPSWGPDQEPMAFLHRVGGQARDQAREFIATKWAQRKIKECVQCGIGVLFATLMNNVHLQYGNSASQGLFNPNWSSSSLRSKVWWNPRALDECLKTSKAIRTPRRWWRLVGNKSSIL